MPDVSPDFVARVKELEECLFADQLHAEESTRMKSDLYSWLYRPSHHAATGLIVESDIEALSQPGKRLLSVGAHPAFFERVLCELGIPSKNILIADNDLALGEKENSLPYVRFDMLAPWPDIGNFDLITFPESLCIALSDSIEKSGPHGDGPFATDALESQLLAHVLTEALRHLKPNGEIRANGPQSHPNVVKAARALLDAQGFHHELIYQRYFLTIRAALCTSSD